MASDLATQNGGNIEKFFTKILLSIPTAHILYFIFEIVTTFSLCCLVSYKEKRPDEIISQKQEDHWSCKRSPEILT